MWDNNTQKVQKVVFVSYLSVNCGEKLLLGILLSVLWCLSGEMGASSLFAYSSDNL